MQQIKRLYHNYKALPKVLTRQQQALNDKINFALSTVLIIALILAVINYILN